MIYKKEKKIFICPLFRIQDIKNIFNDEEIIYLPLIKKSKFIFVIHFIIALTVKYLYKNHAYQVWIIDQPRLNNILLKFLFLVSKNLEINYLSMNVEFDLNYLNYEKCKKIVLFSNQIFPFVSVNIPKNFFYNRVTKDKKLKILYFGELNLEFSKVKDPEISNIILRYQENNEPSVFVDEIDDYLNKLYMTREIGNLSRFEELTCARNAQRFYYLTYLQKKFPGHVDYIGSDLIRNGLIAEQTSNSRSYLNSRILESKINLDLGSKSFSHTLYPRSLMILNENPQSLLQLCQYDSKEYIKRMPSQLAKGSELVSRIKNILQIE
jgi:hypothetical protein